MRAKFHDPMLIITRDPPIKLAERGLFNLPTHRYLCMSSTMSDFNSYDTENALQQVQEVMHDTLENKE